MTPAIATCLIIVLTNVVTSVTSGGTTQDVMTTDSYGPTQGETTSDRQTPDLTTGPVTSRTTTIRPTPDETTGPVTSRTTTIRPTPDATTGPVTSRTTTIRPTPDETTGPVTSRRTTIRTTMPDPQTSDSTTNQPTTTEEDDNAGIIPTSSDSSTSLMSSAVPTSSTEDVTSPRTDTTNDFMTSGAPMTSTTCKPTGQDIAFDCQFNITKADKCTDLVKDASSQVEDAYRRSFLELRVKCKSKKPNCEKCCLIRCDTCDTGDTSSDNVKLIAFVNGITIMKINYIDFESISIDGHEDEMSTITGMYILVGCLLVVILLLAIVLIKKCKCKKTQTKTQRMTRMTFRPFIGRIWNTYHRPNRQEAGLGQDEQDCDSQPKIESPTTEGTINGFTNVAIELEAIDVCNEEDYQSNEPGDSSRPPMPNHRPVETLPPPRGKNPYVDLTETTHDPIYVNQAAEDMRPRTSPNIARKPTT